MNPTSSGATIHAPSTASSRRMGIPRARRIADLATSPCPSEADCEMLDGAVIPTINGKNKVTPVRLSPHRDTLLRRRDGRWTLWERSAAKNKPKPRTSTEDFYELAIKPVVLDSLNTDDHLLLGLVAESIDGEPIIHKLMLRPGFEWLLWRPHPNSKLPQWVGWERRDKQSS